MKVPGKYSERKTKPRPQITAGGRRKFSRPSLKEQLEKVAASVPGLICSFRLHPDGSASMPYASPAIGDLYGLSAAEVAMDAGPIFSRMPAEDRMRVSTSVIESARTMTRWHAEWRYYHPTKGERWMEGCSMPTRERDGSVLWHGYIQDISERKERERQIESLNAFLRLVIDGVPALIAYVGADLRYRMVNRGYQQWFGLDAKHVVGHDAQEIVGAAAWQKIAPHVARALAGERVEYETEIPYGRGGTRWVRANYLPDVADDGEVRGFVVMVVDLSERRRVEEELRRARQSFLELLARQDSLLDAERRHMAHEIHDELGQLLTGMRLTLSAARLRGDEKHRTDIEATVAQLGQLVDAASGVVRGLAEKLRPALLVHGLLPALEGLAADFRGRTRIACRLTVSGKPCELDDVQATTAFRVVQESLTNIARHARAVSVSIHLKFASRQVRLLVQDDGQGFTPLTKEGIGGGLGLFGMRERAAAAGGKLKVFSTPGRGTRIELDLPIGAGGAA